MDSPFYNFNLSLANGESFNLKALENKLVLIVNVASQCGFTPQYRGLEQLYQRYRDQGLVIIGCPCNQFGQQEPRDEAEILNFCSLNYEVSFPITQKLEVNGPNSHPLYVWLKTQQRGFLIPRIKWNFTKFLVNRQGQVIKRFSPSTKPETIEKTIQKVLLR